MKYALVFVLALALGGCVLTETQRQRAVEGGAQKAASEAYKLAYDEAVKQGKSEGDAKAAAQVASDVAYARAKELLDKTLPQPSPDAGKSGGILETILAAAVNLGLGFLKKGA